MLYAYVCTVLAQYFQCQPVIVVIVLALNDHRQRIVSYINKNQLNILCENQICHIYKFNVQIL